MHIYYKSFLHKKKITTFSSGMMPLSGMELSANKVEVQKAEQPDSAFKDKGEKDYASKSMITEFRKKIRSSESKNKIELKRCYTTFYL